MKHEWIDYYVYLENLRRSGRTNMWLAGEYLEKRFGLNRFAACEILSNWMKFYNDIEKYLEEKKLVEPRKD